ncbi:hypothetical protein [Clostridium sp. UBA1652]|uniref:hypothetical protein n=1 Tax=Clostridium sp. UBA1652 TaxID=1946348 RepID=UPI00257B51E9|nr:hypothetical protein [Clostridium sp. UBA1652]
MRLLGTIIFICGGIFLIIISLKTYKNEKTNKFRLLLNLSEGIIFTILGLVSLADNINIELMGILGCVILLFDRIIDFMLNKKGTKV